MFWKWNLSYIWEWNIRIDSWLLGKATILGRSGGIRILGLALTPSVPPPPHIPY